jgi:hypothetical protein
MKTIRQLKITYNLREERIAPSNLWACTVPADRYKATRYFHTAHQRQGIMRKLQLLVLSAFIFASCSTINDFQGVNDASLTRIATFEEAFARHQSNIQVMQEGVILSILADDNVGDRHQRMIVRLNNDQTLLITHNIDIAARVENLVKGKKLRFCGEYEWNSKGGLVHWTHKDPNGQHVAGWLEYAGKRYD